MNNHDTIGIVSGLLSCKPLKNFRLLSRKTTSDVSISSPAPDFYVAKIGDGTGMYSRKFMDYDVYITITLIDGRIDSVIVCNPTCKDFARSDDTQAIVAELDNLGDCYIAAVIKYDGHTRRATVLDFLGEVSTVTWEKDH